MKWGAIFFAAVALVAAVWYITQSGREVTDTKAQSKANLPEGAIAVVKIPVSFSEPERGYDAVCAGCHGANAQGREGKAPPLVHKIYEPSHHGDMAFVLAAKNGVRAHHWKFGNMPAVEGVTQAGVLNIIAYVRALQKENGID